MRGIKISEEHLPPFSTMRLATDSSKMVVHIYQDTRRHFPEYHIILFLEVLSLLIQYFLDRTNIGTATLCGSCLPPRFRNSKCFRDVLVSPTPNPKPG
jgi:hypothetical protein